MFQRYVSVGLIHYFPIYPFSEVCQQFHLMRQSKLKMRANKQFVLVDNDAQRIEGRFLNHSTVYFDSTSQSRSSISELDMY